MKMTAFQVETAELSIYQRSIPLMNHHARQEQLLQNTSMYSNWGRDVVSDVRSGSMI